MVEVYFHIEKSLTANKRHSAMMVLNYKLLSSQCVVYWMLMIQNFLTKVYCPNTKVLAFKYTQKLLHFQM